MVKVYLIDSGSGQSTNSFPNVSDVGNLNTFLATYSGCGVKGADVITPVSITTPITPPQADSNLDRLLTVHYKDVESGAVGKVVIPSPVDSGTIGKRGERISLALANTILNEWKTCNGIDAAWVAKRGVFTQKV